MSWHAVSWAKAQRTGSPSAKVTLLVLAEYCNADGECWPSRETIAEDTEQSVDTVDRRLRELEAAGFIIKVKRRSGSYQATSVYRLNFDVVRQKKHLRENRLAHGSEPQNAALAEPQNAVLEPEPQPAVSRAANGPVSEPQLCGPNLYEPPKEPTPQPPQAGAGRGVSEYETKEKEARELAERFRRFWRAYPAEAWMAKHAAERSFGRLDPVDQEAVIRAAERYGRDIARTGRKVKDAARWIRDRVFEGYVAAADREGATPSAPSAGPVFILPGTPQWAAWEQHYGRKLKPIEFSTELGEHGRHEASEFPPASGAAA